LDVTFDKANVVSPVKSLLIVYSYHHNNTLKVAEAMAKVLEKEIQTPQQTNPEEPQKYDLVGFGAGIDSGKHYKVLLDYAEKNLK
jgi:flavodoxin